MTLKSLLNSASQASRVSQGLGGAELQWMEYILIFMQWLLSLCALCLGEVEQAGQVAC